MNTVALAAPASKRCNSNGVACVKKPLKPINTVASTAPHTSNLPGAMRRSNSGVTSAPSK